MLAATHDPDQMSEWLFMGQEETEGEAYDRAMRGTALQIQVIRPHEAYAIACRACGWRRITDSELKEPFATKDEARRAGREHLKSCGPGRNW
jgi:hypothetical protein